MAINLPTELLRSLVAIIDSGSMLRATEQVFVTQSALSLQMKRLEELVQVPLFHRDGRRLTLTPAGETLLTFARDLLAVNDRAVDAMAGGTLSGPVRVGLVQDFAETLLAGVLAQFAHLHPQTQLQVRVAGTQELLTTLDSDRLDFVLAFGERDDDAGLRVAPMLWLGVPELANAEVLPLAILEKPCRFRDAAVRALDAAGRRYRIMLETPNLAALRAAVEAGLGVTCRTAGFSAHQIGPLSAAGLPPLPEIAYVLRIRRDPHPTIQRLAEFVRAAVIEL